MANLRADNLTGTGGRNALDGSLFFNGNYDGLAIPSIALGSGNWTIEFWFYSTKEGSQDGHIYDGRGTGSASSAYPIIKFDTDEKLSFYTTGAIRIQGASVVELGSWNHVALVKNSSTTTLYLNGQSEGTYSDSNTYLAPSNSIGKIGSDDNGSGYFFYGYLSNYRFVTGTAVYTAAFTPPTEKLTAVENTVLLCCQDSDDATQEATGKTITGYGRYFASTGEKFANTGFTADSDWTKGSGWTIANGLATHAQGSAGDLAQQISGLVVGQTYKLSVDILTTDNDVAYFFVDNNPGGNYPPLTGASNSPVGHHFIYFDANATTMWLGFRGSSLWAGTLTNLRLSSVDHGKAPKVLPPYVIDEGVVVDGYTKINSPGVMYFPTGDTSQRGRGRGLFAGAGPSLSKEINYIQIQSQGNTTKFGDLTTALADVQGGSSSTRGLFGAGGGSGSPGFVNTIEYVTIATTANATDFGDLNETTFQGAALANDTRYVYGGGTTPTVKDVMDYITIASEGNATDFGNLTAARFGLTAFSSPTRGIYAGGATPTIVNTIDYIPIASAGNATDFGDVTSEDTRNPMGASSSTRGVIAGGQTNAPSTGTDAIDFLTIATTGNTTDFGNLTDGRRRGSGLSNSIRGVFTGGYDPSAKNTIDYITIASTGNAQDFGDYSGASIARLGTSASDSHGGLS